MRERFGDVMNRVTNIVWRTASGARLGGFAYRYDAVTGRWLSKDPIGLSGGLNLYAFCGGNPTNFRDPVGRCKKSNDEKTDDDKMSLTDRIKNWAKAFFNASKSQLKPVSGAISTTADVLEGVPSGFVLKNQIDGWRNAMQSLQNSGMEEGDPGGILKSSEDAVRKGGEIQDAIMNR